MARSLYIISVPTTLALMRVTYCAVTVACHTQNLLQGLYGVIYVYLPRGFRSQEIESTHCSLHGPKG